MTIKEKIVSIWTHVVAVFRIDDLRIQSNDISLEDETKELLVRFDEIFGKECLWESSSEIWSDCEENPEKYLPCGSEGTLHKVVYINPDRSDITAYVVTVYGDLRDYEELDPVLEWFKQCCNNKYLAIRQACIMATNGLETKTLVTQWGEIKNE